MTPAEWAAAAAADLPALDADQAADVARLAALLDARRGGGTS